MALFSFSRRSPANRPIRKTMPVSVRRARRSQQSAVLMLDHIGRREDRA